MTHTIRGLIYDDDDAKERHIVKISPVVSKQLLKDSVPGDVIRLDVFDFDDPSHYSRAMATSFAQAKIDGWLSGQVVIAFVHMFAYLTDNPDVLGSVMPDSGWLHIIDSDKATLAGDLLTVIDAGKLDMTLECVGNYDIGEEHLNGYEDTISILHGEGQQIH